MCADIFLLEGTRGLLVHYRVLCDLDSISFFFVVFLLNNSSNLVRRYLSSTFVPPLGQGTLNKTRGFSLRSVPGKKVGTRQYWSMTKYR